MHVGAWTHAGEVLDDPPMKTLSSRKTPPAATRKEPIRLRVIVYELHSLASSADPESSSSSHHTAAPMK